MEVMTEKRTKTSGPALAAVLSAGIGCAVTGVATVLASAFAQIKNLMNWWDPAGPLTGKTGVGVIAWLVTWGIFHLMWREREPIAKRPVILAAVVLVLIGFVLTFPPVFEAFEPHK